jgi:hypothetical protein
MMTESQYEADLESLFEDLIIGEITAAEYCSIAKSDFGFTDLMLVEDLSKLLDSDDVVKALTQYLDQG